MPPGAVITIAAPLAPPGAVWRGVDTQSCVGPGGQDLRTPDVSGAPACFGWVFEPTDPLAPPEPALGPVFEQARRTAFASVPWPAIAIRANPSPVGLVGLPTHYWVSGYAGGGLRSSTTAVVPADVGPDVPFTQYPQDGPRRRDRQLTVTVDAWPVQYAWSWGDGTSGSSGSSLGRPFSLQSGQGSDIVHQYEWTSLRHLAGFPVVLTATFGVAYTVEFDGSSERRDLPATTIRYSRNYLVQEIQSVLVSPRAAGLGRP